MSNNTIFWLLLAIAVWYFLIRRQKTASTPTIPPTPTVQADSSLLGWMDGMNWHWKGKDPRSSENWPKPAVTPPDPAIGLPDLSVI